MPDSKLKQITDALLVELNKIASLNNRASTKVLAWHTTQDLPAAFLAIGSEDKQTAPTTQKRATATFTIACIVQGDNPLDEFFKLYKSIEDEIEDDPMLGALVLDSRVIGFNALITDETIASGLHVADIFVEIDYRHLRGIA